MTLDVIPLQTRTTMFFHNKQPILIEAGLGIIIPINPIDPKKGFQLNELYTLLDCNLVEVVRLHDGRIMICDEEAKLVDDPIINEEATRLYRINRMTKAEHIAKLKEQYGDNVFIMSMGDDEFENSICGNVIVCPPEMFD